MSYSGSGYPVFQWTNPAIRYPSQWIITPYFNGVAVTAAVVVANTETTMNNAFGVMSNLAVETNCYDQILVMRYDNVVPSSGYSGISGYSGDMVGTIP